MKNINFDSFGILIGHTLPRVEGDRGVTIAEGNLMALSIDDVNTKASKATMLGWALGLVWIAYYGTVPGLSIVDWLILIVAGLFGATIIIGGGMAMIVAGLTKLSFGKSDARPELFALGVVTSPVIAFFCVGRISCFVGCFLYAFKLPFPQPPFSPVVQTHKLELADGIFVNW